MANRPGARTALAAIRGNKAAVVKLMEYGFQRHKERARNLRREIEHRHANEWEAETAREKAMAGEVPPEQTAGAFADLHRALLRVLAYTPASLLAGDDEVEEISEMWVNSMHQLVLLMHNPTIKYGVIGGFRPEVREEVEDYFNRYNREIWGTILALTSEEEITASEFPPETGSVIESVAESAQQRSAGD